MLKYATYMRIFAYAA